MSKQIKSYFTPEIDFLDKSTVKVDKNNLREGKTTGKTTDSSLYLP